MATQFTPSQIKAISYTGSDILISAGAGSGKTATLTERIIRKILGGADITKMLVVTFTKEAANELKSRITAKLAAELKNDPSNAHLRSQIVKMSSANISTIHSFCLSIIKPNFDKLSIDSDFRIGEENEIQTVMKETMSEVIDSFYEDGTPSEDFLTVYDCYSQLSSEDVLSERLLSLYEKLSSTSLFLDSLLINDKFEGDFLESTFGQVLVNDLCDFCNHFKKPYSDIIDQILSNVGTPKFLSAFTSDLSFVERLENALKEPRYMAIKEIIDSYKPLPLNGIKDSNIDVLFAKLIRDKFKKTVVEKYQKRLFVSNDDSIKASFVQNNKICVAIYNILSCFHREFAKKKSAMGICDFNDIERFAHSLLIDEKTKMPTPLAKEISQEFDEIYVDEYQDTNSVQDSIFSAISRNNRFMVGDIKQSIYRFRSAEPEIFSSYRSSFEDITSSEPRSNSGKTIFMSDNFRCDKSVIETTNAVSDYMFLNSSGIPYEKQDHLGFKKILGENCVSQNCEIRVLDRSLISEENEEKHEALQARYVALRIQKMINTECLPNGKKISPSDIAILLRKGRHKSYYIDALNELGIAAEYIDRVNFFEKPHVLLLLSLLNIVDNPYKDTYLAGALLSPVFDFTFDDLIKIKSQAESNTPLFTALINYQGDKKITEKIEAFKNKLSLMQQNARRLNAYEAISYVMSESGLLSFSTRTQRKDLIKLYNHARVYEKNSFKGLYKFLLYIEEIRESSSDETVFTDPYNCVRIMSIHASKGLEFEICFLCNTETGIATQDTSAPILFERHLGIAGFVGNTGSLVKYNTLLRRCAALAIDRATKEEEMRILYVAMTRARSKLIITAALPDVVRELEEIKLLSPYTTPHYLYTQQSLIEYILNTFYMPAPFIDFERVDPNTLSEISCSEKNDAKDISEEEILKYQNELKSRFEFKYEYDYLNKLPSKLTVSKLKPNILDETENDEIEIDKPLDSLPRFLADKKEISAAERGTATHVFMQFCDFENLYKNGYESELARLTGSSFITEGDASLINSKHIEKFAKSELLLEMLGSKKLYREFRFNVMLPATGLTSDSRLASQSVLVQGVIDAVFENERGELVLVDYKTDRVSEENYKDELISRHKSQLEYYKKAVELMFERPVSRVMLYSVPLAKTVEL